MPVSSAFVAILRGPRFASRRGDGRRVIGPTTGGFAGGGSAVPDDEAPELPTGIDPVASRRIFLAMLALIAGGEVALALFPAPADPPPAAIARDPLLTHGHP